MRLHLEWSDRLSLVFLFADGPGALARIRQWTDDAWQWRTAPMRRIVPTEASAAPAEVMRGLQGLRDDMPTVRAPAWVELLAADTPQQSWDVARAAVLARLNESREWLTSVFQRPLILCLPTDWLREVGHLAPDLWHVRSFVARVADQRPTESGGGRATVVVAARGAGVPGGNLDDLRRQVKAAERRFRDAPTVAHLRAWWDVADDLAAALLKAGDWRAGLAGVQEALSLARRLRSLAGDGPQVLRDLSISLDRVGDAEREAGRGEAALGAYRESLEIRRKLREALGDGPQVLRDLSVSLNKLGDAEREAGRGEAALGAYRESLEICRKLRDALGDGPQVLRDLSVSLNKLGDAEREAGRGEAALGAYRESLEICRKLREALGDGPQVLDDLALVLERLAALDLLPLVQRRAAIDEAMALRERLLAASPGSLPAAQRLEVARRVASSLPPDPASLASAPP